MNNWKTIIWFQGESSTTKDVLLIDGKEPECPSERENAFNFLINGRINNHLLRKKLKNKAIEIVNKVPKEVKLSLIQHEWYLYLNDFEKKKKDAQKKGVEISPSLLCYEDINKNILIRSHFINLDDSGRRIVYSFCARSSKMEETCKLLKSIANDVGKNCNEKDFDFLIKLEQLKKKSIIIFRVHICLLIILAIVMIWIINN